MQAAIQAATMTVKVIREADPTTDPHTRRNTSEESHRQRQDGVSQPAFD